MRTILLSLFVSTPAWAAGFFVHDVGHVGVVRQGAVTASGEDLTALWYNPANLSAGRGLRVQIDVNVNFKNLTFQRAPDPTVPDSPFPVANNILAFTPVPDIALAYDFGVPGLALAFGVYAPNNTDTKFKDTAPTRYSVVTSGSFIVFYHLGLSYQPLPWLRLGVGLVGSSVYFDQRMAVSLGIGAPESRDTDIYVDVFGQQHFLINGNAGVWVKPGGGFELGASFLPGRSAAAKGRLKVTPPKALQDALQVMGDGADFHVSFPWIARGGVSWRYEDIAVVEANVVYEGWSAMRSIDIYPRDISYSVPPLLPETKLSDIRLERAWKDTYSLRIGGEVLVHRDRARDFWLRIRAGYGYEPGAVPDDRLSVGSNDTTKHNLGLGVGVEYDRWKFAVGYGHSFYLDKTITNSQMRLTNPLTPANATVVANGAYHFSHEIVTISVGAGFL